MLIVEKTDLVVCVSGADLLDLLLSATDDQGQPFTDQEIKEESLTFVAAGSETTGNLMVWLMYVLMTHDDVLQACREEIDRVLPNGTELTNEHLSELVICEGCSSMRLFDFIHQYRFSHGSLLMNIRLVLNISYVYRKERVSLL